MSRKKRRNNKAQTETERASPPAAQASWIHKNAKICFLAVFVLALTVRALYLLEVQESVLFDVLMGDARQYDAWARTIAAGDWFGQEVFYQAPFYPYFLGAVYSLAGHDVLIARVVQILLGSASCLLLALTGRRFFSLEIGLLSGVLLAIYPPAIFFDALIQKTVLGLFFMTLLLYLLSRLLTAVSFRDLLLIGVSLGCFALTRENALVLYGVILFWLFVYFSKESLAIRLRWAAWVTLGTLLVLIPIGLRNQAIGGDFLLTTSQAGPNFYIGNNLSANGQYKPLKEGRGNVDHELEDARSLAEADLGRALSPAEISRYWLGRALHYIVSNPGHWSRLMWRKWLWVWNRTELMDTESLDISLDFSVLLRFTGWFFHFGLLAPLAAVGVWVTRGQWRKLWLLYLISISIAASVAVFFVFARYRFPMVPVLALFAAAGIIAVYRALQQREYRELISCTAVALAAAVFTNWPLSPQEDHRALAYHNLGVALNQQGRHGEALAMFEQGLRSKPDSPSLHTSIGRALARSGRTSEAVEHFKRALDIEPDNTEANVGLGLCLAGAGSLGEAAELFEQALEKEPENVDGLINLGNVKILQGKLEDAISLYERGLRLQPSKLELHLNLANAYIKTGRPAEAITCYRNALSIEPNHADAHLFIANLLAAQGNKEEALGHYESALKIQPDNPLAQKNLRRLRAMR